MTQILRGQLYEYGVLVKTHERSTDVDTNPLYPRNDSSWPRQYTGDYFIDKLGVSTFEEYLEKNPENLTTNRIIWFYAINGETGGKQRVHSGNLTGRPPQAPSPEPLGDDAPRQQQTAQPSWPQTDLGIGMHGGNYDPRMNPRASEFVERDPTRQRVLQLTDEIIDLRQRLAQRDSENNELKRTCDEWQRKSFEAERKTIQAQADLDVANKTRDGEIRAIKQEYESKIEYLERKHTDELDIMRERAQAAALKQYEEEHLSDEDDTSKGERMMEMMSDLMPKIEPFVSPLLKFLETGLQHYARKWGAPPVQPQIQPPPQQPQQAAPPSQMPEFDNPLGVNL